jgi:hypothetical protein
MRHAALGTNATKPPLRAAIAKRVARQRRWITVRYMAA